MQLYFHGLIIGLVVACGPSSVSVTAEKDTGLDQVEDSFPDNSEVDNENDEIDCETSPYVSWDNWIRGALSAHCQGCHATTSLYRYGAPEGVYFDEETDAMEWIERINIRVLQDQTMPPAGGLLPEELSLFEIWIKCWN